MFLREAAKKWAIMLNKAPWQKDTGSITINEEKNIIFRSTICPNGIPNIFLNVLDRNIDTGRDKENIICKRTKIFILFLALLAYLPPRKALMLRIKPNWQISFPG